MDYFECEILNGNRESCGCYSENFLKDDEEIITLYRLISFLTTNTQKWMKQNVGYDRYLKVCELAGSIGCEYFKEYLSFILTLDALILNEDRHLNNICFIKRKGKYFIAPIFDNGLSLLSDINDYPIGVPLSQSIRKVKFKPFSVKYEKQLKYVGISKLIVDYDRLMNWLDRGYSEYNQKYLSRAINILKIRLRTTEGIIWEKK